MLRAGKAQEAVAALRHSLIDAPNNGWALYVLADAASKAGDAAGAAEYRKLFDKAWAGAAPPDLDRL